MLIKLGVVEYIQSASSSDFSRHAFIVIIHVRPSGAFSRHGRALSFPAYTIVT